MVWALMASIGQEAEISAGTTPRRYCSIGSSLTTLTFDEAPVSPINRRTPRKRSYADGVDHSWRVAPLPGRMRIRLPVVELWRVVPSVAVTVAFHVVVPPDVLGTKRRRASTGKVLAMPSMDHEPPRP